MRCRRIGVWAYRRTRDAEIVSEASSLCFFLRPVQSGTLRLHESLQLSNLPKPAPIVVAPRATAQTEACPTA
jgi:hypothetical protein